MTKSQPSLAHIISVTKSQFNLACLAKNQYNLTYLS